MENLILNSLYVLGITTLLFQLTLIPTYFFFRLFYKYYNQASHFFYLFFYTENENETLLYTIKSKYILIFLLWIQVFWIKLCWWTEKNTGYQLFLYTCNHLESPISFPRYMYAHIWKFSNKLIKYLNICLPSHVLHIGDRN